MRTPRIVFFSVLLFGALISLLILFNRLTHGKDERKLITFQDKEYIFKKRIKELSLIKRDIIELQNIANFNDSSYSFLDDRIKHGKVLVLFIPRNFCDECIKNEYNRLKNLTEGVQSNIIVLTNFATIRDLKVFLSSNSIDYPIYNHNLQLFDELGHLKDPVLFILDSTLVPQHLFIPISFMPDFTDEYLKSITTNVFNISQKQNVMPVKVVMENRHYNFEKASIDKQVETSFELTNISELPLLISNVESTCGCTVVDWSREPVHYKGKAIIKVKFQTKDKGYFSKKVSVFSNATDSPHIFTISGKVD